MMCPRLRCCFPAMPFLGLALVLACSESSPAPSPAVETPLAQEERPEPFDVAALLDGLTPDKACSLMRNARFFTAEWQPLDGGSPYRCASQAVDVETTRVPLDDFSNTIVYSVEGDAQTVRRFRLRLSIASKIGAALGHTKLMEHASVLFLKLARRKLPRMIHQALLAGTPAEAEIEGIHIQVVLEEAPRRREYDLSVTFQLPAQEVSAPESE